ncbi:MAG: hypothetical protein QOH55_2000 [Microbacteriaceae bacterium]|jgi:hypothetical protein|nr:hypothetical protein [Microbacteriaceae bacterium]
MATPPSPKSRLLKFAVVSVQAESRAPFTITGVDIWNDHAVVYGKVIDRTLDTDWSTPDEVRFDGVTFELGPLTVEPGPATGEAHQPKVIVVSTLAAPSANPRTVTIAYGDVEVTGTIGNGQPLAEPHSATPYSAGAG